jgi:hypothetical protein
MKSAIKFNFFHCFAEGVHDAQSDIPVAPSRPLTKHYSLAPPPWASCKALSLGFRSGARKYLLFQSVIQFLGKRYGNESEKRQI